jgi:hypothetical protein
MRKDTFAFGVDLQRQQATMQLKDRQIVHRSLDRDFPRRRFSASGTIVWPVTIAENRLHRPEIHPRARAVDERLEDLVHPATDGEDQVAAVLQLVIRVLIAKPTPQLLIEIKRETETRRIDPPVAGLAQSPYSPSVGQGVCDPREACGIRDLRKNSCPPW